MNCYAIFCAHFVLQNNKWASKSDWVRTKSLFQDHIFGRTYFTE